MAENHNEIYAAVGVHPHDAKLFDDVAEAHLAGLVRKSQRVVAWGEIGLDYHYDHSPRDVQREVFRRQLVLAREVNLPVIIHSREAAEDTVNILREELSGMSAPTCCIAGGSLQMAGTQLIWLYAFAAI